MRYLTAFVISCLTFAALHLHSRAEAVEVSPRPNFVFVYADDWRWDCLGIVQREQGENARFPWLQTPRMDRFAERSVRINQSFVVNSLCSPGRASVLTGRYSHAHGIIGNRQRLPVDTVTFATRLQEAGYTTAYCGKWHMNGQRERPGFDFVASFVGQGRYFDCPILLYDRRTANGARPSDLQSRSYVPAETTLITDWIDDVSTTYAIEFLERQPQDEPFFLFLGFKSPHGPRGGDNLPERVRDLYAGERSRDTPNIDIRATYRRSAARDGSEAPRQRQRQLRVDRDYMRHITAIDECVGRLVDALDRSDHANNTIVIVTSDNGYYLGEHGMGDKRTAYEESMRVPLLIRLPGGARRGTVIEDEMVLNIDYGPTILDFAGAKPLPDAHGQSLRPLLTDQSPSDWRTAFHYQYFKEPQYAAPTVLAVRTATHKLITYPENEEWTEVFDLQNDPYETENLVEDEPLLEKLRGVMETEMEAVAFRMPEVPVTEERPRRRARTGRTAGQR